MLTVLAGDEFKDQVLNTGGHVLVEFGAEWCAPCKRLEPILEQLSREWGEKVRVFQINVEDAPDVAADLFVLNLPTLILFSEGKERERLVGLQTRERILEKIGKIISS